VLVGSHDACLLCPFLLQHFTNLCGHSLGRVSGFLVRQSVTRPAPSSGRILVTTYWASLCLPAIDRAFAGSGCEAAVVAAEAAALLPICARRVRHYEVAIAKFPNYCR